MNKFVPLIPDARLLEIIRSVTGISPNRTDWENMGETHADMNSEINLMRLARLVSDEAQARLPLWELEKKEVGGSNG